jgi:predicted HicB family RNase H-like nuclease
MTILRHKGYVAQIEIEEDDGTLFGEVINAPGVITFYGKDVAELKAEFARSVEAFEALSERHRCKLRRPLSGRFMIRMTPDQHLRVSAAAALAGKSINAWAVEALDHAASEALEN